MERKTVIERNGKKYFFDVIFKEENYLNYPYTGGYYLNGVPMIEEVGASGRINNIKEYEFEVLELLIEYDKADEKGFDVAKKIADKHVDSVILQIEQNKRDKKMRDEVTKRMLDEEMDSLKDFIDGFNLDYLKTKYEDNDRVNMNMTMENNSKNDDDLDIQRPKTTLDDVAGLEEVKEELKEVINGLSKKEVYEKFKLKPISGVILYGEPGCGKSLISRAIAGETNATYIEMAGSEFIEKYVGVGAKRVRDLFNKARSSKPCIVFIDEIDAVGGKREEENSKEANATLNQLLVELANPQNEGVVVIGATNRMDILDPALIRQGRLGKHIFIGNPSKSTRYEILKLHTKNRPIDDDVDLEEIAKRTHGFSGSDMEAIINEACIYAIRQEADKVSQDMLYKAIDRIQIGISNKSRELVEREVDIVSYHESSHAVVGMKLNNNKISKISIISVGEALGYVSHYSDEDTFIRTKEELEARIMTALAGAVGEEIFFGHKSSGCSGDLETVSNIARAMVTEYGMSEKIGKMAINGKKDLFMQQLIHEEMKKIVDECYKKTKELVEKNRGLIEYMAKELKEKETMEGEEVYQLAETYYMKGE